MHVTHHESAWVRILGGLFVLTLGFFLVRPILPATLLNQPLADAASLRALESGSVLPQPPAERHAEFQGKDVLPPALASLVVSPKVLGVSNENKHIEVDLTNQKVYAFDGANKVMDFTVSTGKWAPTPTGEFTIWSKVRSQKMEGGNKAWNTYYYLPNVPYVMFFYNNEIAKMRGFSLHGTYWHDNFGNEMSHGCVNMRPDEAKWLFRWLTPVSSYRDVQTVGNGTRVNVS